MPIDPILGADIPDDDPIRKFVLLILYQAKMDRATHLIIGEGGDQVRYEVDGEWYEMAPSPLSMHSGVVSRLLRMASVSPDMQYPKEGVLIEMVQGVLLAWKLAIQDEKGICDLKPFPLRPFSE